MHYFRHLNQVVFLGFCLTVACWGAASAQTATPTSKSSSGSEGSATTPSRKEDVYQSAKASFDRNDYAGALAYLDQAISLENPASGFSSAQALAGYLHLSERLITRNSETAKRYLAQAAERGDWRAAVVLSGVLLNESLVQTPQMTQRFLERAR
jgi:TPR repeat protein